MTTKVVPGQLVATFDAEHVAREAAARIGKAIRDAIAVRGAASLALSGGNTPRAAYEKLAKEPAIDWAKVDLFWVDERAVAPTDPRSNYRLAKETLIDRAGFLPDRVHRMPADATSLVEGAREYETLLRKVLHAADSLPSFDALILGIGDDGHTASLFPGEPHVEMTDRLVLAVPAKPEAKREARLTLSAPVIENARSVFILAVGAAKSPALERVWSVAGNVKETPARIVRGVRGAVTWIIDKAAGGMG